MLYHDTIARGHEVQPLTGVRAEVHPAASGARGTRFLTIIGPGFAWTQRSDVLHEGRCRKFAAKINAAAGTARQPVSRKPRHRETATCPDSNANGLHAR